MFPRDPDGPDLASEHRALSAWGDALEARHAALMAITDQLNLWVQDVDDESLTVLDEAYEVLWGAYESEQAALDEAFLLLDLGFEVLAQAAEASGIDLDELDDEPGWA